MSPLPLHPSTIARLIHVSSATVYQWIQSGKLPALNVSTINKRPTYRVYHTDLIKFLKIRGLPEERIFALLNLKIPPSNSH